MQTRKKRNFVENNVVNKNDYNSIIKSSVKKPIPKTKLSKQVKSTKLIRKDEKSIIQDVDKSKENNIPIKNDSVPIQQPQPVKKYPTRSKLIYNNSITNNKKVESDSDSESHLTSEESESEYESEEEIKVNNKIGRVGRKKKVLIPPSDIPPPSPLSVSAIVPKPAIKSKKKELKPPIDTGTTPIVKVNNKIGRVGRKKKVLIPPPPLPPPSSTPDSPITPTPILAIAIIETLPLIVTRRKKELITATIIPKKKKSEPKKRKHQENEKDEEDNEMERQNYINSINNNSSSENKDKDSKLKQQDNDQEMVDEMESVASSFEDEFDDFENGFYNIASIPICKHLFNISIDKPRKKLIDPNFWKCEDCSLSNSISTSSTTVSTTSNTNSTTASNPNIFICLTCGFTSCASSKKKHLTSHFKSTSHPLFLDLNSKFCYCFNCNGFIENDNSKEELEELRQISYSSGFQLIKSRLEPNEKITQDDIEETALNHFEMSLTRKFFNIWKSIVKKGDNTSSRGENDVNSDKMDVDNINNKTQLKERNNSSNDNQMPQVILPIVSSSVIPVDKENEFKIRSNIKTRFGKKNISKTPMILPNPILSESESESSGLVMSSSSIFNEPLSTPQKTSNRNYSSTYLMSKVASSPVKQNKIIPGVTGLRNLGNTCFMNTILQALSNIPEFRKFFVEYLSDDESINSKDNSSNSTIINTNSTNNDINLRFRQSTFDCLNIMQKKGSSSGLDEDLSFTKQLRSLFRLLWAGRWTVVTPHLLLESVWKHIPKFKTYQQQDAQEFLSYLLDHISGELNPKQKLPPKVTPPINHEVPTKSFRSFSSRKKKKLNFSTETLPNNNIDENNLNLHINFQLPISPSPSIPITLNSSSNSILTTSDNIKLESLEVHKEIQQQEQQPDQSQILSTSLISIESDEAQKPPSTPPDDTLSQLHKDRNVPEPMLIDTIININNNHNIQEPLSNENINISIHLTSNNNIINNNNVNNNNNNNNKQKEKEIELEKLKEKEKETIISKMFQGKLKSEIICLNCNNNVSRIEPFLELTLDIPFIPPKDRRGRKKKPPTKTEEKPNEPNNSFNLIDNKCSLEDCIKFLVKQEDLNGKIYQCDNCASKQNAKKKFSIDTLPSVLCIVLKRFSYTHRFGSKISTQVRFPFELNLTNFINNNNNNEYNYELLNVINHHGSGLTSGHYTAYCFNDKQEIWVHYNDTKTTIVEAQDVIDDSQSNAYILFYQKK